MLNVILLLIAGLVTVLAYSPFNQFYIIYASIAIVMFYTSVAKESFSYKHIFCYSFAYFTAQFYWFFYSMYYVIGTNIYVATIGSACAFAYFGLYIVLAIYLFKSISNKNYILVFPSAWVLMELLRGYLFTGFSWGDISYTQVDNVFLQGYFPLFGSYGVSWITLSLIGSVFQLFISTNKRYIVLYITTVLLIGLIIYEKQYTNTDKVTTIAGVQGNISHKWENQSENTDIYYDLVKRIKNVDLVVLPETAFIQDARYISNDVRLIVDIAAQNHEELISGIPKIIDNSGNYVNAAVLLSDKNQFYAKAHLVPFGEFTPYKKELKKFYSLMRLQMTGFHVGDKNQEPMNVNNKNIAINICYENGFGRELIYAASKSTFMLNISDMSWYGTTIAAQQHLELSRVRAMENQRYFVQITNSGETAVINIFGEIVSNLQPFTRNIIYATIPNITGKTPYQRFGDIPVLLISGLILLLFRLRFLSVTKI